MISLLFVNTICVCSGQVAAVNKPTKIEINGETELNQNIGGKTVRVIISMYTIDVGPPRLNMPKNPKTNCTYSRTPCSQVSNLRILVEGKGLIVPRSVFADSTDLTQISLDMSAGMYVLNILGGNGVDSYTVKVFFNAHRIKKRELYSTEDTSLLETTTYMPVTEFN
jgi:hypothetical protein